MYIATLMMVESLSQKGTIIYLRFSFKLESISILISFFPHFLYLLETLEPTLCHYQRNLAIISASKLYILPITSF